jgi:hypothetical protein
MLNSGFEQLKNALQSVRDLALIQICVVPVRVFSLLREIFLFLWIYLSSKWVNLIKCVRFQSQNLKSIKCVG